MFLPTLLLFSKRLIIHVLVPTKEINGDRLQISSVLTSEHVFLMLLTAVGHTLLSAPELENIALKIFSSK